MKLLCLINFFTTLFPSYLYSQTVAFYYGDDFKNSYSKIFNKIVVQPDKIPQDILKNNPDRYYAYLSIGEFNDEGLKETAIGYNRAWKTYIGDIKNEKYRNYLITQIEKLKQQGFKNFFFDTIDSYQTVVKDEKQKKQYINALIDFIKDFKRQNPESDIILNRPFDMLEELRSVCDKIAAESLYYGIDPQSKNYIQMRTEDTLWLKEKLNNAKKLGYNVYVIDYSNKSYEEKVEIARKIFEDGFIPYITDSDLKEWGVNYFQKINKNILMIYDSDVYPDAIFSSAHRIFSVPLEYYGYIPKLTDIKKLPSDLSSLSAAVFIGVSKFNKDTEKIFKWIKKAINSKVKIFFISEFPIEDYHLESLGIKVRDNPQPHIPLKLDIKKECIDYEIETEKILTDKIVSAEKGEIILSYSNSTATYHSIVITDWGGYVSDKNSIIKIEDEELLGFNPFCLFKKALNLKNIPVPDITTLNGNRILFVHIDGDGFRSQYENSIERQYSGEVLLKEILLKYQIPHSVSVIRGEIENPKIDESQSSRLKKIARDIFLLPYVEVANHSFSHPHSLVEIKKSDDVKLIEQLYDIKIDGYKPDIHHEIIGTKKWIEENIIPEKKNELYFWTGNCIAPYEALKLLYENSILNINGGFTYITKNNPFLSLISPAGIERNGLYQIYAAQQNENIYTNLWSLPKKGYKNVIETFELTDKPLRLKPINIYYHFYSASRYDSLKALKEVYDYALSKEVIPLFTSQYIKSAIDFYNIEIFNYKNQWIVLSDGNIKTLRIKDGFPEIKSGVCGYRKINEEVYTHMCSDPPYFISITSSTPEELYIENSNAFIESFSNDEKSFYIKFKGYIPVKYRLRNFKEYRILEKDTKQGIYYIKEVYGTKR